MKYIIQPPDDLDPEPLKHFYPYVHDFNPSYYDALDEFEAKRKFCYDINEKVNISFDYIAERRKESKFLDTKGKNALDEAEKDIHYFRNVINYEPPTLLKMLEEREKNKWVPVYVTASQYHMHGDNGEFNLKWLAPASGPSAASGQRMFETVYGIEGKILDEKTDCKNMGTYNYGFTISSVNLLQGQHNKLDMTMSPRHQQGMKHFG